MSVLCHREASGWSSWKTTKRLTACGQEWSPEFDNGSPTCDVCFPDAAHPLAAIWRHCARLDDRYNAEISRSLI